MQPADQLHVVARHVLSRAVEDASRATPRVVAQVAQRGVNDHPRVDDAASAPLVERGDRGVDPGRKLVRTAEEGFGVGGPRKIQVEVTGGGLGEGRRRAETGQ